jgi:CRISPR-associated endonuclease/helicase Cas3
LPEVDLGTGEKSLPVTIDLSLMSLGESASGQASWLTRVLTLRDSFGPFRLSFLETLVRVADWRGSEAGDRRHGN